MLFCRGKEYLTWRTFVSRDFPFGLGCRGLELVRNEMSEVSNFAPCKMVGRWNLRRHAQKGSGNNIDRERGETESRELTWPGSGRGDHAERERGRKRHEAPSLLSPAYQRRIACRCLSVTHVSPVSRHWRIRGTKYVNASTKFIVIIIAHKVSHDLQNIMKAPGKNGSPSRTRTP